MVILTIADRAPSRSIKEIISENQIDLICTLGDLTHFDIQELRNVTDIPKIGVYGNHDSGKYMESLGIKNLHLQTFEHQGLTFGGFEGALKYKPSAALFTQDEASELLKNFPAIDVMISHSPPYGINDEPDSPSHAGFIGLRDYIKRTKPKYFLHGHTYPNEQASGLTENYLNTKIIYVFKEKIIELT